MTTSSDNVEIDLPMPQASKGEKLTPERMIELNLEHAKRFMEGDIDGVMEHSLTGNPVYEMFPMGVRFEGRELVRLFHERSGPVILAQVDPRNGGDTREIHSLSFGDNTFTCEFSSIFTLRDGTQKRCYMAATVTFEGEKLVGERVWLDDNLVDLVKHGFGDDFWARPDIQKL